MREIALFFGKIYTAGTNFTQPPVMTAVTNLNSGLNIPDTSSGDEKNSSIITTKAWKGAS